MRRQLAGCVGAGLAALLVVTSPVTAADSAKPIVAIVDFDATPSGRLLPPPQLGETAAQLMLDRLVASGAFRVYDGHWLQHQRRDTDRRDRLETVRAGAESAGIDYLLLGTITRFSEERRNRSFGGGAFRLPIFGGMHRQRAELVVAISVRLVDTRSGEIVTTATGMGTAIRTNMGLGGLGLLRAGGVGGFSNGSSDFRDAQLDEAIRRSIELASVELISAGQRLGQAPAVQR
jgi:curli biogenesis system outer membrane secretion channel CsgG